MTTKPRWIQKTREYFREFLDETDFPDPKRIGSRGPKFANGALWGVEDNV